MSAKGSWSSYNLRSFLHLVYRYRSSCSTTSLGYSSGSMVADRIDHGYSMHQRLKMIRANCGTLRNLDTNMMKVNEDKVRPPSVPNPPRFSFPTWAKWTLGSILSIVLPFWKQKWLTLKKIEGEVEIGIKEVENVAEVVEKVATMAENVSAEVAQKLPDNSKLEQAAVFMEHFSKTAAHDAQLTKDFIHKVDDLKHDFEDLETMVEPVIEKLVKQKSQAK